MRNPQTIEARIVEYFQTAPAPQSDLLWGIIRGIRTGRRPANVTTKPKAAKRTRKGVNINPMPSIQPKPLIVGGFNGPE